MRGIDDEYQEAADNIGATHEWHKLIGDFGNALDAAEDDERSHECHDQAEDPLLVEEE